MDLAKEIDIIVPVYNRASFIEGFLEQLRRQTHADYRLYFACGESQDDTDRAIREAMAKHPEMAISMAALGFSSIGRLRNFWLDSPDLKGRYIAFLDIDDRFDPAFLETLYQTAEKSHSDLVQCAFKRTNAKNGKIISLDMAHNPSEPLKEPLDYTNIVFLHTGVPAKLFRREAIGKEVRFADCHRFEDVAFVIKFLATAKNVAFVNTPLYDYVLYEDSVSAFTSKEAVDKELHDAQSVLLDLKTYYAKANPKAETEGFVDSLAFVRYGIGLTTRACLSKYVKRRAILKDTSAFLETQFPNWKTSRYLANKNLKSFGKKTRYIKWCKFLYRHHSFGVFVSEYALYTRLFKKDIKP
jgi:glycosyltransferase involved in cell wall biosynthesis